MGLVSVVLPLAIGIMDLKTAALPCSSQVVGRTSPHGLQDMLVLVPRPSHLSVCCLQKGDTFPVIVLQATDAEWAKYEAKIYSV